LKGYRLNITCEDRAFAITEAIQHALGATRGEESLFVVAWASRLSAAFGAEAKGEIVTSQ
jgi:hypothetical protein